LNVTIDDNGVGIGNSQNVSDSSKGISLAQERSKLLNKLKIKNQITISKIQPHGTRVKITMPKTRKELESASL